MSAVSLTIAIPKINITIVMRNINVLQMSSSDSLLEYCGRLSFCSSYRSTVARNPSGALIFVISHSARSGGWSLPLDWKRGSPFSTRRRTTCVMQVTALPRVTQRSHRLLKSVPGHKRRARTPVLVYSC